MKKIWILLIGLLITFPIFNLFIGDTELTAVFIISVHSLVLLFFALSHRRMIGLLLGSAFVIRFITMLWDIFGRHIYSLPHSGADTESFLRRATFISGDLNAIWESSYEFFIQVIAFVFTFTADERLIFQYINVVLGFTSVYLVYLIFKQLNISKRNIILGVAIAAFFPHAIIFSGILLREMLSAFFMIASFYFLIKWYNTNKIIDFSLSIAMVLVSALFHSGVIVFVLTHLFIIVFYNQRHRKIIITRQSLFLFVFTTAGVIAFLIFFPFQDLAVFRKLSVHNINEVFEQTESARGGSAYLRSLSINNVFQFIIFGPIFVLYFIMSPLPHYWRGFEDIISFGLDGVIIFIMIYYFIKNIKKVPNHYKNILIFTLVGIIAILITFGVGVQNAGTALRHRNKIFYIILVLFIIAKDTKRKKAISHAKQPI